MSILTCLPCAILEISSVIFSISAPLRPITIPGRAVKMVTRMLFQARSITIFDTAAMESFCFTKRRIFRSAWRHSGNSFVDAYQRDRQSLFSARRNPIGLTFCPILTLSLLLTRPRLSGGWSRLVRQFSREFFRSGSLRLPAAPVRLHVSLWASGLLGRSHAFLHVSPEASVLIRRSVRSGYGSSVSGGDLRRRAPVRETA